MFSVAVWLELGPSFWSDAKTSPASVVLGRCWGRKNVSMTLKIWRFVIWTTEWKLSRWYSLWSSNYATPSLPFPDSPHKILTPPFILIQEWSRKAALSPVNYFQGRRNGFVSCCITSPILPLIPLSRVCSSVSSSRANLRCKKCFKYLRGSSLVAVLRHNPIWRN